MDFLEVMANLIISYEEARKKVEYFRAQGWDFESDADLYQNIAERILGDVKFLSVVGFEYPEEDFTFFLSKKQKKGGVV